MDTSASPAANRVIGAAIDVHRELGPGLLESAYCHCLAHELTLRGISFLREYSIPVHYRGSLVDCGFRIDFLIDDSLIVEVKSVDSLNAVHHAQLLTYLKLSGVEHGLLINFNARLVRDGIKSLLLRRSADRSQWKNQS
jgi:GxxExxY protein